MEKGAQQKPTNSFDSGKHLFENALWGTRLLVLIPVVSSILIALEMFYIASVDTYRDLQKVYVYTQEVGTPFHHDSLRSEVITDVVEAIDGYLLGIVMLIFALGIYELFVDRLSAAAQSPRAKGILVVHSLDDLKSRLGEIILLMLVVKFFELALGGTYVTPFDYLILAGGILCVAGAVQLTRILPSSERAADR
jgi:uncharacterized membrane protein YqhA